MHQHLHYVFYSVLIQMNLYSFSVEPTTQFLCLHSYSSQIPKMSSFNHWLRLIIRKMYTKTSHNKHEIQHIPMNSIWTLNNCVVCLERMRFCAHNYQMASSKYWHLCMPWAAVSWMWFSTKVYLVLNTWTDILQSHIKLVENVLFFSLLVINFCA